jgi:hypothetical protein
VTEHPSEEVRLSMMDRPAYELVRLIEAMLDDADQVRDTPARPNLVAVWGIRALLEPYGGTPHRWQWPHCFDCGHQAPMHNNYGPCDLCDCMMTHAEVVAGARDESLDRDVEAALRLEAENNADPRIRNGADDE